MYKRQENAAFIKHALADDSDMIAGMMGMHAQFTISDETMALAAANKPDGVGYHIHVAEGIEDLHDCLKKHGKRIVDRLMDCNISVSYTHLDVYKRQGPDSFQFFICLFPC